MSIRQLVAENMLISIPSEKDIATATTNYNATIASAYLIGYFISVTQAKNNVLIYFKVALLITILSLIIAMRYNEALGSGKGGELLHVSALALFRGAVTLATSPPALLSTGRCPSKGPHPPRLFPKIEKRGSSQSLFPHYFYSLVVPTGIEPVSPP